MRRWVDPFEPAAEEPLDFSERRRTKRRKPGKKSRGGGHDGEPESLERMGLKYNRRTGKVWCDE